MSVLHTLRVDRRGHQEDGAARPGEASVGDEGQLDGLSTSIEQDVARRANPADLDEKSFWRGRDTAVREAIARLPPRMGESVWPPELPEPAETDAPVASQHYPLSRARRSRDRVARGRPVRSGGQQQARIHRHRGAIRRAVRIQSRCPVALDPRLSDRLETRAFLGSLRRFQRDWKRLADAWSGETNPERGVEAHRACWAFLSKRLVRHVRRWGTLPIDPWDVATPTERTTDVWTPLRITAFELTLTSVALARGTPLERVWGYRLATGSCWSWLQQVADTNRGFRIERSWAHYLSTRARHLALIRELDRAGADLVRVLDLSTSHADLIEETRDALVSEYSESGKEMVDIPIRIARAFSVDKGRGVAPSKHKVWTPIVVGLTDYLETTTPKRESLTRETAPRVRSAIFRLVGRILHLRYPTIFRSAQSAARQARSRYYASVS